MRSDTEAIVVGCLGCIVAGGLFLIRLAIAVATVWTIFHFAVKYW
jgi:hypothetical protein